MQIWQHAVKRTSWRARRVSALPSLCGTQLWRLESLPGRGRWSRTACTPWPQGGQPGLCGTCQGWARLYSRSERGTWHVIRTDFNITVNYITTRCNQFISVGREAFQECWYNITALALLTLSVRSASIQPALSQKLTGFFGRNIT